MMPQTRDLVFRVMFRCRVGQHSLCRQTFEVRVDGQEQTHVCACDHHEPPDVAQRRRELLGVAHVG